jgi:hypothetical protein
MIKKPAVAAIKLSIFFLKKEDIVIVSKPISIV